MMLEQQCFIKSTYAVVTIIMNELSEKMFLCLKSGTLMHNFQYGRKFHFSEGLC